MNDTTRKLEELMDDAERQGWRRRDTEGGHFQLFAPDGKAIVVAPGTPSDFRSYANFLADLKRNGYKPPDDRVQLMAKRASIGLKSFMAETLKRKRPDTLSTEEVFIIAKSKFPEVIRNSVSQALSALHAEGKIVRIGTGVYKWGEATAAPAGVARVTDDVQPQMLDVGDDNGEDDERELDEALVALSRIEAVVRKHKGIARQLRDLKKILGAK